MKQLNSALAMVLIVFFASCQKSSLLGNKGISNLINGPINPVNPAGPGEVDPKDPNNPDGEPTPAPPGPNAGKGCTADSKDFCYGGYGADNNPQSIPTKVIFLNPVGSTLSNDPAKDAKYIIDKANGYLIHENNRFIQFKAPIVEKSSIASLSEVQSSPNAIRQYGSTEYYVLILVKDFLAKSNGIIGYSPGLRIDWQKKESIVVMDYDYVMSGGGDIVIVHELFHGLGAPHTTDGNGGQDNAMEAGLVIYGKLKNRNGSLALEEQNVPYEFKIYLDENHLYEGTRNVGSVGWDTRTLMFQYAKPYKLFLNTSDGIGFNNSYSKILSTYYDQFVKK